MAEHFPRQFGKYVLLKSLARGGMGEIYLAASGQPGGLNKLCVIKKVITGKADRAKINRFLDEAKVVLRLSHGNLVSTFDAGDVRGELFIAMELVEGKDLREIWNRCVRTRTRIPVDVALVVVREVARALAYVHSYAELRLVHRDVAPPNILLSYFGEVKLTDFGLARSILKQEHTAPGVVFGRASYLAPEQARGEVADGRTDVYSLGIVLWELLTGQPYLQLAGLDPVTSLSLVRNPKPQPPSSRAPWIGPELDSVVLRALAADRLTRFQSAEELRRSLSDVMSRVAPRADAERVAEFLRGLYRDVVAEERAERERLLDETLPLFRGERLPEARTPRTDIFLFEDAERAPKPVRDRIAVGKSRLRPAVILEHPIDLENTLGLPDGPDHHAARVTAEPSIGSTMSAGSDAPKESLHVSALRARAGSQLRRLEIDVASADAPTKIWRKTRGAHVQDAAQTFVGRVIDNRYRIHHRIGEGGMGTVYAAEHVEIGKSVAVKILHRIFSGEEELVERFRREARAASRVGHPHIIDVTDFGTTEEGCAYFVMELLEGMDLADVLVREGRLDAPRAVRIGVQICQALEAAHTSGIIHRDLKPENIFLVARDGQADFVKVLDFGIARNLSGESRRLTNPGMAMGTPEYMAPEQSEGKPADRRTDVYAVGALLHEMVVGVAPFHGESAQQMLEAKRRPLGSLRGQLPDLPATLDAVIVRALAADPERRPQTMAQLEYELAKIAWGRPQAVANLLGLQDSAVESAQGHAAAEIDPDEGDPGPEISNDVTDGLGSDDSADPGRDTFAREAPADAEGETPPPLTEPGPFGGGTVDDLEKLLEADLSAPVEVQGRTLTVPAAVGLFETGLFETANAPTFPQGSGRAGGLGRTVATLLLLAVLGAAATWAATHGAPDSARHWARWLRERWDARRGDGPSGGDVGAGRDRGPSGLAARAGLAAAGTAALATRPLGPTVTPLPVPSLSPSSSPSSSSADSHPRAPEIVETPPLERARTALAAGMPDDAIAVLRPVATRGNSAATPLLADALVASGWLDVKAYRWNLAGRKAREALTLSQPSGPSHGGHALLGEAAYALGDFNAALAEFTKALTETPGDARLKRRVIRSRRQLRHPPAGGVDHPDSLTSEAASE